MKFLKNDNIKILKKSLVWIILFIIFLYSWVFIYSYIFEQDKIAIDNYNFEQLEKVKLVLDKISTDSKKFYTLKEFNKEYNEEINPIKNCYYVSNSNWNEKYIFWFQLESLIYKFIKFWGNYAYPKYNLPADYVCTWWNNCNYDFIFSRFIKTISNPCQD